MYRFVSFDLDNTLYSYDTNSQYAVGLVMDLIVNEAGLDRDTLWETYIGYIKRFPGPKLFSDGRTSYDYRYQRFSEILAYFRIRDAELAERCVRTYADGLLENMRPYPDVVPVLTELAKDHLIIIIITDAPRDIQERILVVLGIDRYVHRLFSPTTGGNVKEDGGLFLQALEELGARPSDVIHIGDSYLRDIQGAQYAGIRAVYVRREKGEISMRLRLGDGDDMPPDVEVLDGLDELPALL